MSNKKIFKINEGDRYFLRNYKKLSTINYEKDNLQKIISNKISSFKNKKIRVLEIGCGDGGRLTYLKKKFENVEFYGLEPSKKAKRDNYKLNTIKVGTAEKLPFKENFFDILIFGFCLYLTDSEDLFQISSEAYRVTKKRSWIIIKDFDTEMTLIKKYKYNKNVKVRKMDYSKMFLWHPNLLLHSKQKYNHDGDYWTDNIDKHISIIQIRKKVD